MKKALIILIAAVGLSGCSTLMEAAKGVAGTSTQSLERARTDSIYQVYPCDRAACFGAVVDVALKNGYYIFIKDEAQGVVVLMGIPGYVDTTEVGAFLTEMPQGKGSRVEISSRSSPAKRAVAKVILSELSERFNNK